MVCSLNGVAHAMFVLDREKNGVGNGKGGAYCMCWYRNRLTSLCDRREHETTWVQN